jgi:hypothetical protein
LLVLLIMYKHRTYGHGNSWLNIRNLRPHNHPSKLDGTHTFRQANIRPNCHMYQEFREGVPRVVLCIDMSPGRWDLPPSLSSSSPRALRMVRKGLLGCFIFRFLPLLRRILLKQKHEWLSSNVPVSYHIQTTQHLKTCILASLATSIKPSVLQDSNLVPKWPGTTPLSVASCCACSMHRVIGLSWLNRWVLGLPLKLSGKLYFPTVSCVVRLTVWASRQPLPSSLPDFSNFSNPLHLL